MNSGEALKNKIEKVRARLKAFRHPVSHAEVVAAGYTEKGFTRLLEETLEEINKPQKLSKKLHADIRKFLVELTEYDILPSPSAWPRKYFTEKAYYRDWEDPKQRFIYNALNSLYKTEGYEKGFEDPRVDHVREEVDRKFAEFYSIHTAVGWDCDGEEYDVNEKALELGRLLIRLFYVEGLATELLEAWRTYEEFVYLSKSYYRDHFLHLIYDFFMGCKLLCSFTDRIHKNLEYYTDNPMPIDEFRVRLMRSWLAASLFHDIGYAAEALSEFRKKLQDQFFFKIPGFDLSELKLNESDYLKDEINDFLTLLSFVLDEDEFSFNFGQVEKYRRRYPDRLMYGAANALFTDRFKDMDHGIMSALFLLLSLKIDIHEFTMYEGIGKKESNERHKKYRRMRNDLLEDIVVGAFAISIHNIRINAFEGLTIDFRTHPITFILMLCDDLHEWDRQSDWRSKPEVFKAVYGFEVLKTISGNPEKLFDEDDHSFFHHLKTKVTALTIKQENELKRLVPSIKAIIYKEKTDSFKLKRSIEKFIALQTVDATVRNILDALCLILAEDVITLAYVGGDEKKRGDSGDRVMSFWKALDKLFYKNLSNGPSICIFHGYDEESVRVFFTAEYDPALKCYRVNKELQPIKKKGDIE